jgi:hypothetical protein
MYSSSNELYEYILQLRRDLIRQRNEIIAIHYTDARSARRTRINKTSVAVTGRDSSLESHELRY